MTAHICCVCEKSAETSGARLARGWKRINGGSYCNQCKNDAYIIRANSFQIAEPLSLNWKELEECLRDAWGAVTACANWMLAGLFAIDPGRQPGDTKLSALPKTYFYPEARKRWPSLVPNTVNSIEQQVTAKYRKHRYAIHWTGRESLPSMRYPQPLPIHNRNWRCERVDGRPVIALRLTQDGPWIRLRLKGGDRFRRQIRAFDLIEVGAAIAGEAAIYRRGKDILLKLVAHMPREARKERSGELHIRTDPDSMLVGLNQKSAVLWNKHADQARRWAMDHRRQLQRWADDSKFERRPVPAFSERRRLAAAKFRHRMSTLCHQTAAEVAGYAERRGFASVVLTDSGQRFLDEFPWFELRTLIQQKLDAHGIAFEYRERQDVTEVQL